MNNFVRAFKLFFVGEFSVLFIVTVINNIRATLNPLRGGHSFEQGGMEGVIFGLTISLIIVVVHTLIFLVPLFLSTRYGLGVLNIKPFLASLCGVISGIALLIAPDAGGIPAVIFAPTFSFCVLIVVLELYAKKSGITSN